MLLGQLLILAFCPLVLLLLYVQVWPRKERLLHSCMAWKANQAAHGTLATVDLAPCLYTNYVAGK